MNETLFVRPEEIIGPEVYWAGLHCVVSGRDGVWQITGEIEYRETPPFLPAEMLIGVRPQAHAATEPAEAQSESADRRKTTSMPHPK